MANKIVFYETERGDKPVQDFIRKQNTKERQKTYSYLEALAEQGNSLPSNYIKPLGDGLWEFRPEFGGTEFRLFYFVFVANTIIVLHAIKKKTQKTPTRDLALARKRKEEYEP